MTKEQCEESILEYGVSGFEGWVECMDEYPELDDIVFDSTGDNLPETVISDSKKPPTMELIGNRLKNLNVYYLIGGLVLILLLGYFIMRKK